MKRQQIVNRCDRWTFIIISMPLKGFTVNEIAIECGFANPSYFANSTPKDANPRIAAQTGFSELTPELAVAADSSFVITYARRTSTVEDVIFQCVAEVIRTISL